MCNDRKVWVLLIFFKSLNIPFCYSDFCNGLFKVGKTGEE